MKKLLVLTLVICLQTFSLYAQETEVILFQTDRELHPRHEFMVQFSANFENWEKSMKLKEIYRSRNIYKLEFPFDMTDEMDAFFRKATNIKGYTFNQLLRKRLSPNDEYYPDQWFLEKIMANNSWDISQGGLSPLGDTIVVAILDDGFFPAHEDLVQNIWKNNDEIPGDGIDNDQNGYIDDYMGWNMLANSGEHSVRKHGTAVAGIIGAQGNNNIGTTGINWNVKLLLLSEANSIADVIEAYQYVLDLRKKYNESGGSEGAFIVATNLSSGINSIFPEDNPIYMNWCNIYDDLGKEGILNVNSTTNSDTHIDLEGDMPATCPSEFLIVATNSDEFDNKVTDAGYGKIHVDIAAPGQNILTTSLANKYENFNGTSSSSPAVAGAIALLYAAPCLSFGQTIKDNPETGARQMKNMILSSVDKNPSLAQYVKSEGRLNIYHAMELMREFCGGSTGQLQILSVQPNPIEVDSKIIYESSNYEEHLLRLHNILGQLVWSKTFIPSFFGEKQYQMTAEDSQLFGTLPNGYYILSISQQKDIDSQKVIIMN